MKNSIHPYVKSLMLSTMDRMAIQAGKTQEAAVLDGQAGHHVKTLKRSRRLPVFPARVRGRLSQSRSRHRHVSFGLALIGSIIVFSFLMRLISFCKFRWRRGGVSGGFEGRLPVVNVPRRLADNRSGDEGIQGIDRQCVRLLGSAEHENTEPGSIVPRTRDEAGSSEQLDHRFLASDGGVTSSTAGVNGNGGSAGGDDHPAEELQESLQRGQHTMERVQIGLQRFFFDSGGRGPSGGGGRGTESQWIRVRIDGASGSEESEMPGEERALENGVERGSDASTRVDISTDSVATTEEEPPPYEEAVNQSGPWRVESVQGRSQTGDGSSPSGDPPSYLDVLQQDIGDLQALTEYLLRHGRGGGNFPFLRPRESSSISTSELSSEGDRIRLTPRRHISSAGICGIVILLTAFFVVVLAFIGLGRTRALQHARTTPDYANVTSAPAHNVSVPEKA